MEYVARLLRDTEYLKRLEEMERLEEARIYCRHGFSHLMDVARLGCLLAAQEGIALDKEQFYLLALLHDLGRIEEYKYGISHAEAGKKLAGEILLRIGYPKEKAREIAEAIGAHRDLQEMGGLAGLLYRADKRSRPCFLCGAKETCKWEIEQRNQPENWE